MTENEGRLSKLRETLAGRQATATESANRKAVLLASIARWTVAQDLDGADHASDITNAQAEISAIDGTLTTFAAVQNELQRRISEADKAVAQDVQAARIAEFERLRNVETELRKQYAAQAVALLDAAGQLNALFARKIELRKLMPVDIGSTEKPIFHQAWLGLANGKKEAIQAYTGLLDG